MKPAGQVKACRYVPQSPCPTYEGPEGDTIIILTEDDSAIYVRLLEESQLHELTIVERVDYQHGHKLQYISAHTDEGLKMVMGVDGWIHVEIDRITLASDTYTRTGETVVDPELVVCPPMRSADA